MKWLLFRIICFCAAFFHHAIAQDMENTSVKRTTFLEKLIPEYSKIQYAGSMGMFSVGPGWVYGRKHWETDLLTGFIPTDARRPTLFTLTLKQNYIPWWIHMSKVVSIEPLATGVYLNAILNDKNLWTSNPDRYPDKYYWHSNRFKFNLFLGQRLKFNMKANDSFVRSISTFYEVSTCDLYMVKIFTDNYLKPKDYLTLSLGVRFEF